MRLFLPSVSHPSRAPEGQNDLDRVQSTSELRSMAYIQTQLLSVESCPTAEFLRARPSFFSAEGT
jgi:hypothetical protein